MKGRYALGVLMVVATLGATPFDTTLAALQVEVTSTLSDPVVETRALTFVITATNTGDAAVENVVVSVPTPDFMWVNDAETSSGDACIDLATCYPGLPLEWNLGTLEAGGVRSVFFSDGTVSSAAIDGSQITAAATVSGDGVPGVDASHTVTMTESLPVLQLAIAADRDLVAPGSLVTLRLRYSNLSPVAHGDEIVAKVPAGTSFVSAGEGGVLEGDEVRWQVDSAGSTSGSREFTLLVGQDLHGGTLLRIPATFSDIQSGASAHADELVAVRNDTRPLRVSISSSPDSVEDGQLLSFMITVSNTSDSPVGNVEVLVPTPDLMLIDDIETSSGVACVRRVDCDPGELMSWSLGTLEPGGARTVFFSEGHVRDQAIEGSLITALAVVNGSGVSTVRASHTVRVSEEAPALQLSMSAERYQVAPGSLVKYSLRYSNLSPNMTGDELVARIPEGTSLYAAGDGGVVVGDHVRWSIGSAAFGSGTREFIVLVDNGVVDGELLRTDARFSYAVGGASAFANEVVVVRSRPQGFHVAVEGNPDPALRLGLPTFTITVTNAETTPMGNVEILVPIPESMVVINSGTIGGTTCLVSSCSSPGRVLSFKLGTLEAGGTQIVSFSTETLLSSAIEGFQIIANVTVTATGISTAKASGSVKVTVDSDGDGMSDAWESINGFNPDEATDAALDADGDGLTNLSEYQAGTSPWIEDTDGDGVSDQREVWLGLNASTGDSSAYGVPDWHHGTKLSSLSGLSFTGVDGLVLARWNIADEANQLSAHAGVSGAPASTFPVGDHALESVALSVVGDVTGDSVDDIVLLGFEHSTGRSRTFTRGSSGGEFIRDQSFFTPEWRPLDLGILSSTVEGQPDMVAVLAQNRDDKEIAVQIRDAASGAFTGNAFFLNGSWTPRQLLVLSDMDSNPGIELGVLATNDVGQIVVMVKDALSNTFIRNVFFLNVNWEPLRASVLPDFSGNGADELALLARNRVSGQVIVMVRDSLTNEFLGNVFPLGSAWRPVSMIVLPDETGNGAVELAVLGQNESSGALVVQLRDAAGGEFLRNLRLLGGNWAPMNMIGLEDIGDGNSGLSVLAVRPADGVGVIQTLDASTGAIAGNVFIQP